uniref:Uncharacterized protein n=1 Tax=Arundo donax TaxID=35708 RepID=A0A0A9HTV2_ARUDO
MRRTRMSGTLYYKRSQCARICKEEEIIQKITFSQFCHGALMVQIREDRIALLQ